MRPVQRPLIRLAAAIHAELTGSHCAARLTESPAAAWRRCDELAKKLRRCELRRWQLAADLLRADLRHALSSLQVQLADLAQELAAVAFASPVATFTDVYQDLVALEGEFEKLSYDRRAKRLSVTTEPIELEGRYLGPFEIRLDWSRRAGDWTYRVIALDPQPAATRESVTHPHVLDEILCEGDGRTEIRRALVHGRLLDFFTLVASVLRTYCVDSPFVELALWDGQACSDCGAIVDDEYRWTCDSCASFVCDECAVMCGGCECSFCASCIASCFVCEDNFCGCCLRTCDDCRESVCSGCRDGNNLCPKCQPEELDDQSVNLPQSDRAAVLAHGLGQAPVPA